ncbi:MULTISPECIES: hypothetical protein [Burkholderia]|uniref:hypothetical protein n=1 Tax=Burkholderia TaxID=32008 RepID=UPI0011AF17E3|nr:MULTISPECIES: hypothetical protein [unclassified Burkholderia]
MNAEDYFDKLITKNIPIVVDTKESAQVAHQHGFEVIHFDECDFLQNKIAALLIISTYEYHEKLRNLWNNSQAILAHLAIAKFDNSTTSLHYSLSKLLSVDCRSVIRSRSEAYTKLLSNRCAKICSPYGQMTCSLNEEVEIANDATIMKAGWLYSIAEFFEASIVNISEDRSSFTIDGEFIFNGLIYLFNNVEIKNKFDSFLNQLMISCSSGENKITFEDNIARSIIIGGLDRTSEFNQIFSELERGLTATEFSLGCAKYNQPVDWKINSLLNEGVSGIHIGIGMGRKMPHIDFISTCASLQ